MPVGTKNFPTSLDTVLELVEVTNDASTQLNGALTIGATTITVDSTSLFPSSGIITIDSENISYTGKTGTTFTGCTRGAESTTAATHEDNATVELLITAALPNVHAQAIIAIETKLGIDSSTPTANKVLRATGTGTSAWGAVVNADIDASAAIAVSKLAALTASRLPVLDASGFLSASSVTATEAGYLSGVTSAIQTQLDAKQTAFGSQTANYVYAGPTTGGAASPAFRALVAADIPSHNQAWSTITSTPTTLSGYGITDAQGLDSDLTAIAGLSPLNDDVIQRKAGAWTNRTPTQLTADLIAVVGDSGSGGTKGLVPAPAAGDAAASKFLKADGTWATAGGGLTVGTTAIASGAAGRFLYETSGNALGEISTLTSDGTIVTFSPTVTTGTGATAGLNANANSLTTGDAFNFASSSVTSGNVVKIAATGTAAASNTKTALNISTSGANATSTMTTYGARFSNTSTGTSSTNIGADFSASGGTTNTALQISAGRVVWTAAGTFTTQQLYFSGVSPNLSLYAETGPSWIFRNESSGGDFRIGAGTISGATGRNITMAADMRFGWESSNNVSSGALDTVMRRLGAASIAFGFADAASPVAQTLSVQNVVAGTTNTAGVAWTRDASRGTGTGAGGRHVWRTAPAGSSGSSQNSLVEACAIESSGTFKFKTLTFANLPTAIADGEVFYCSDGAVTSGADNTLTSGGSGALAIRINGAWRAFNAQN